MAKMNESQDQNLPLSSSLEFSTDHLSDRELQVLLLAAKGQTDHSIANVLGIGFPTVGTYWSRIRVKLGPYNRTELVAKFIRARANQTLDLLRAENASLLAQLEANARSFKAILNGHVFFESVLKSVPDGILVMDQEGIIHYSNVAAEEVFGYGQQELSLKHIQILVPDSLQHEHATHKKNFMANPSHRRLGEHFGTSAKMKDGTEFPVLITLNSTTIEEEIFVICIVRRLEP